MSAIGTASRTYRAAIGTRGRNRKTATTPLQAAVQQLLSYSRLGWLAGLPCALSVDFDSDVAAAAVAIAVGPAFPRCTL